MSKTLPELIAASLFAACLALPLPAFADPPHWAPAHGYRAKMHRYIYYPGHEVYYAPASQLWFWLEGGSWRVGAYLPSGIAVAGFPGISILLGTERPYEMDAYVVKRYGKHHHKHHGKPRHRHHDHDG